MGIATALAQVFSYRGNTRQSLATRNVFLRFSPFGRRPSGHPCELCSPYIRLVRDACPALIAIVHGLLHLFFR